MGKYYMYYQPNSKDVRDTRNDCVIRALVKATNSDWLTVFGKLVEISAVKSVCMVTGNYPAKGMWQNQK